ncbi:hypothetical protein HMPREF1261_02087 [Corynebacterium sp. KPL1818]|nr:hypothetical protein HMPREF1261_02087 [Corynebacterium sp. KPL1818]
MSATLPPADFGGRLTYEAVGYGVIVLRSAFLEHGIKHGIYRG